MVLTCPEQSEVLEISQLELHAKIVQVEWSSSAVMKISSSQDENGCYEWRLDNLEPGTPYCVRFMIKKEGGEEFGLIGKETVYDTKPIGCSPEKKGGSACSCTVA